MNIWAFFILENFHILRWDKWTGLFGETKSSVKMIESRGIQRNSCEEAANFSDRCLYCVCVHILSTWEHLSASHCKLLPSGCSIKCSIVHQHPVAMLIIWGFLSMLSPSQVCRSLSETLRLLVKRGVSWTQFYLCHKNIYTHKAFLAHPSSFFLPQWAKLSGRHDIMAHAYQQWASIRPNLQPHNL